MKVRLKRNAIYNKKPIVFSNTHFVVGIHIIIEMALLLISVVCMSLPAAVEYWYTVISVLAAVLLLFQILGYVIKKVSVFNFVFIFLILSYLFMFGIVFLLALGLDKAVFWKLHTEFSKEVMLQSGFMILNYLEMFYIGSLLGWRKCNSKLYGYFAKGNQQVVKKRIYKAGLYLFCMSLPFRLYTDILLINASKITSNYFKVSVGSGFYDDIGYLCVPGLIYIISSEKLKRRKAYMVAMISCIYFAYVMVVTGDRRYEVTGIIAILLCVIKTYPIKFSVTMILGSGYLSVVLLNILIVIRNIRKGRLLSLTKFLMSNFKTIFFSLSTVKNTIIETMAEFGISFFSVVQVIKNIPENIGFQYGKGFWGSIPAILPTGPIFKDFFEQIDISHVVNLLEKNPVGQTIVGDFYANFGLFYLPLSLLFGIFVKKFFDENCTGNINLSIARNYSFLYIEINLIRACFFEVFRNSVYIYVIPLVLMYMVREGDYTSKECDEKC